MKNMYCAFMVASLLLSAGSWAVTPYTSSLTSGNEVDEILSSFLPDPIRLLKSEVIPPLLLQKGKAGSIISSPVSEGRRLQPDKGMVFTGHPFELNSCGNENKKQSEKDNKSPPPQEQQSKKQSNKGQGNSGSSGSGAASASASGNDESRARHLEKLKQILKAAKKSSKMMDQKKNIDDFKAELQKFCDENPDILEEKGSLEDKQSRGKAILSLLQLYFPEKLEQGEMTHVLLEYPELKRLPISLIKLFVGFGLPDFELPDWMPDDKLVEWIFGALSPFMIKLMHTYIGFPQCLNQLAALFITQLPLMATEEPKNYIFQVKTGHVSILSIRKNSEGYYRFFFVDSLNIFKHYAGAKTYSPLPHFVALALMLAIKYHDFTDSRFFFLPPRQVSDSGCESFMLHDLETLLESPMLSQGFSQNGYDPDKAPLTADNMLDFFSQIIYQEKTEQLGQLVINGESKDFIETIDKPAFDGQDLNSLITNELHTWPLFGLLLEPDLVKFYQLNQFPLRFAHLTQGQENLKRLLEHFPEERQQEVNQVIDETRGVLTVKDGTCHNNVNLAATLLWMKLNINLLDSDRPGQEK
ncbi:hypothetical protein [Endozoicomonas sp. 4G]|uniref:hypothetical protein n=1 Tax=Endozoicomonas sp. 4G TaxID=2872754 RepID=UPI002078C336|nr:hypothetical protein [Endozoicomonas sp. 4G]